jgi:hypothetical protein
MATTLQLAAALLQLCTEQHASIYLSSLNANSMPMHTSTPAITWLHEHL